MTFSPLGGDSPRSMATMNPQQTAALDALVRGLDQQVWIIVLFLAVTVILGAVDSIHTYYWLKKIDRRLDLLEAENVATKVNQAEELRRRVAELEQQLRDRA